MSKVKVLFIHNTYLISKVIEGLTKSEWSHSAILMFDGILEAVWPRVTVSPLDKYKALKTEYIEVEIPNREAAEKEAKGLLGTLYGVIDCVNGGLHDLTGAKVPGDGKITVNCSEAVTRILRAGGLVFLPDVPADCITPEDLYKALKALH